MRKLPSGDVQTTHLTRVVWILKFIWMSIGLGAGATWAAEPSADVILTHARVITPKQLADIPTDSTGAGQTVALAHSPQAIVIKDHTIVYVGSNQEALKWRGRSTQIKNLKGKIVLPGLIDTHIHPMDIVDLDVCNLNSVPMTLNQISLKVKHCIAQYHPKPGEWLKVYQWNYTNGNQLSPRFQTLRAALDAAAPLNPVTLLGNDGHHGAYNSLALKGAVTKSGQAVPVTAETLKTDYAAFSNLMGVDIKGEPDGTVNETARYLIDSTGVLNNDVPLVAKQPTRVVQKVNSRGITAMLDAAAYIESVPVYMQLRDRGQLTVWTNLALYLDPFLFTDAAGVTHFDDMLSQANALKAQVGQDPILRADTVKLFADGVMEGNPYAMPPALPNSPSIQPYLQPIFKVSAQGLPRVVGYVDIDSPLCQQVVQEHRYEAKTSSVVESQQFINAFLKEHGYHPKQCERRFGQFEDPPAVQMEFVKRFHEAGYSVHIHAISDAAVKLAVDAIENARLDGNTRTRDGLAHVQIAEPSDVARIGRDHLFVAFTYAWMIGDPEYDLTVVPFIEKVTGNTYPELHPKNSRYDAMVYPVRDIKDQGAIITGGSDAPVETTDPRPFVNMARAVSRKLPLSPNRLTPHQAITLNEALEAYTINGAKALGREQEIGSIEVGKSADLVVIDRDIFKAAALHQWQTLESTQVLQTYFRGQVVYQKAATTH
jgi:predicted amidohydrolase YtcJ